MKIRFYPELTMLKPETALRPLPYDPKAAFRMIEPDMENPATFTAKVFSVQPSTGTLVLFSSYLEHKVEVQKSAAERLSLSFNLIFTTDFD